MFSLDLLTCLYFRFAGLSAPSLPICLGVFLCYSYKVMSLVSCGAKMPVRFLLVALLAFLVGSVCQIWAEEGEILPEAARVGAGIGVGEIEISPGLYPGGIYSLPKIPVINTGTGGGTYEMGLSFLEHQPQLRPEESWVVFNPPRFYLEPGETKHIRASLHLPTKARPGDYFSLLEVRRLSGRGKVRIGPAAAAKFYFHVKPTSILGAYRVRFLTFIETNPIVYLILAALLLIEAGLILRRYFRVRIELRRDN